MAGAHAGTVMSESICPEVDLGDNVVPIPPGQVMIVVVIAVSLWLVVVMMVMVRLVIRMVVVVVPI